MLAKGAEIPLAAEHAHDDLHNSMTLTWGRLSAKISSQRRALLMLVRVHYRTDVTQIIRCAPGTI